MADAQAPSQQFPASPRGDGGQASTSQGTPAASTTSSPSSTALLSLTMVPASTSADVGVPILVSSGIERAVGQRRLCSGSLTIDATAIGGLADFPSNADTRFASASASNRINDDRSRQCYGVDQLTLRTLNTVRYLQEAAHFIEALELETTACGDAVVVVRLERELQSLIELRRKQQADHDAYVKFLQVAHSGRRDELKHQQKIGSELVAEKAVLSDSLDRSTVDLVATRRERRINQAWVAELEAQVGTTSAFSPGAQLDFLAENS
ncbi:hypothetical protein PHYPSEUDO_009743 [Phytophthora pseudosyringae]|uniref:Uncharacterized protein n=1 Tax=Phytophthora pseudosyringae TaxID=221518 RepID=A0A8T1VEW8_9STRA|nr:hypothetical protein PHYPSEUDO_009743 [Phytophthora pseudosyringae]